MNSLLFLIVGTLLSLPFGIALGRLTLTQFIQVLTIAIAMNLCFFMAGVLKWQ